jgi:hypothetical protein
VVDELAVLTTFSSKKFKKMKNIIISKGSFIFESFLQNGDVAEERG